jgi:ribosomal protein S18 acetylase RimI-like enzyme
MELRESETTDTERVRELAESTITASYALSPQQIEALLEENFGEDQLENTFEDADSVILVAENGVDGEESTIAGVVKATVTEDAGEVRWLFVDPEHRGNGIGTRLFDTAVETLREQGVEQVSVSTLEANREGGQFPERFGFERTDDRSVEVVGESLVEYVYVESAETDESTSESAADLPNTEAENDTTTATADDGQQVYLDLAEEDSGTEAPFFVVYTDEEFTDQFGYYCANCGSLDTTMDDMGRVECSECSNTHAERSGEAYDDSYL